VPDEIGQAPSDLVSVRLHGLSPVAATDVGALLTNLGTRTVVVVGVSTNIAVPSGVFDLVNLVYQMVVPRRDRWRPSGVWRHSDSELVVAVRHDRDDRRRAGSLGEAGCRLTGPVEAPPVSRHRN